MKIDNLEKKNYCLNQRVKSLENKCYFLENKINDMDKSIFDNVADFCKNCYNKIID